MAVLRVWLDDRPGSLAAVAAEIAALGGDLVGIDVLERGGGRVIDEFVVELPSSARLDDVVAAVHGAPGVDVEFAGLAPEVAPDARLDALLLAGSLVDAADETELLDTLVLECRRRFAGVGDARRPGGRRASVVVGDATPGQLVVRLRGRRPLGQPTRGPGRHRLGAVGRPRDGPRDGARNGAVSRS